MRGILSRAVEYLLGEIDKNGNDPKTRKELDHVKELLSTFNDENN